MIDDFFCSTVSPSLSSSMSALMRASCALLLSRFTSSESLRLTFMAAYLSNCSAISFLSSVDFPRKDTAGSRVAWYNAPMPNIELKNPGDPGCPYSWGKYLGKIKNSPGYDGQDQYEHECVKRKGHWGKHLCCHCGQKVKG